MIVTNYKKFEDCMDIVTEHLSKIHVEYVEGEVYLYLEYPYNHKGINITFYDYGNILIEYYSDKTNFVGFNIIIKEKSFHLRYRTDSIDFDDFVDEKDYFQYSTLYPFRKEFYSQIQQFRDLMNTMKLM